MKNAPALFNFESNSIRVVTDEHGEPLFVGKDICEALGYLRPSDALQQHCKGSAIYRPLQTEGGKQNLRVIAEPDVLRLIVNCTLPAAEAFEKLVFEEILPTIRKTGSYSTAKQVMPDVHAKMFPAFFRVARLIGCDRNSAAISANQAVLQTTGTNILALLGKSHIESETQELVFNVSDLCDGISGMKMNKLLEAAGMQAKSGDMWEPTEEGKKFSRIHDTGKRHGSGLPVQQVKWFKSVLEHLTIGEPA